MNYVCLAEVAVLLAMAGASHGASFSEDFSRPPAQSGWRTWGDSSLFSWNQANQNLEVTWDSSRSNSFFYHPLGTVLAKDDDFGFSFDLRLRDIAIGVNPAKTDTFEIAVGFLRLQSATRTNFFRGTMGAPFNLAEFTYFPDSGWGATISTTLTDSNHNWAYAWIFQELATNDLFHVEVGYAASNQTLTTTILRNGQPYGASTTALGGSFLDLRLDAFSISSYSDEGQDPAFDGSLLAHGTVDNVTVNTPAELAPVLKVIQTNNAPEVSFAAKTNWFYRLEGSADYRNWSEVYSGFGNGGTLRVRDADFRGTRFYRVQADRP